MAKQSGLAQGLYLGGYDLSGDTGAIDVCRGGPALMDVTGIDKSAVERVGGRFDGEIGWSSWFNPSASQQHPVLSALPTADVIVAYKAGSSAIGAYAAFCAAKQVNYDPKRANDGAMTIGVQALIQGKHLFWGRQGRAGKVTEASATNGASIDGQGVGDISGASSAYGASSVFMLFSGPATGSVTAAKWQDSADDVSFADITGLSHTIAAAPNAEILQTATGATIRRYVRFITTGTFTNAVLFAALQRHLTSTI